jgi:hypothetical protein
LWKVQIRLACGARTTTLFDGDAFGEVSGFVHVVAAKDGGDAGEWVGTNFERRYIKDQRPIYTLAARKI